MSDRQEIIDGLLTLLNDGIVEDRFGEKVEFIQTASSWVSRADEDLYMNQISFWKNKDSIDNHLGIHFKTESMVINGVEFEYKNLLRIISFMLKMKERKELYERKHNDKE